MSSTNFPSGVNAAQTNSATDVIKTGSAVLSVAEMISGGSIIVTGNADAIITIPNLVTDSNTGSNITIVNQTKGYAVQVLPHSSDYIAWGGAVVIAKYVENTGATAKKGDHITLTSTATAGFLVTSVSGIWAKEA